MKESIDNHNSNDDDSFVSAQEEMKLMVTRTKKAHPS